MFNTPKWENFFWSHKSLMRGRTPDGHFVLPDLVVEIERMKPGLYAAYEKKKKAFNAELLKSSLSIIDENKVGGSDIAERAKEIYKEIDNGDVTRYIKGNKGKKKVDKVRVMQDFGAGRVIAEMVENLMKDGQYV